MYLIKCLILSSLFVVSFPLKSLANKTQEEQRLACFFYDVNNTHMGESILMPDLPSVWAKGDSKENIYLNGFKQEGFFHVLSMQGKTLGMLGYNNLQNYEASEDLAHRFCLQGIKYAFPDTYMHKKLIKIAVQSSFLSINNMPPVFSNINNKINKLVIFGDSLSDQGNLKNWLRIHPRPPYFAGRFSNGLVWPDYFRVVTKTAIQNWAVAGSVSRAYIGINQNQEKLGNFIKLKTIATLSGSVQNQIISYQRQALKNRMLSDTQTTLFVIWVGGNDYLMPLDSPLDADSFIDSPDNDRIGYKVVIRRVTRNIISNLNKLYKIGARHFLVANLPDLGIVPHILTVTAYGQASMDSNETKIFKLATNMSLISRLHNELLKQQLDTFKAEHPDAVLTVFDAYKSLQDIMKIKNSIEFDNSFKRSFKLNQKSVVLNLACINRQNQVCINPDKALFWDDVHPTSFGHCLIAYSLHETLSKQNIFSQPSLQEYLKLCRSDLAD